MSDPPRMTEAEATEFRRRKGRKRERVILFIVLTALALNRLADHIP